MGRFSQLDIDRQNAAAEGSGTMDRRTAALERLTRHPVDARHELWRSISLETGGVLHEALWGLTYGHDPIWQQLRALSDAIEEAMPRVQQPEALRKALMHADDTCGNLLTHSWDRGFETGVMMEQIRQTMVRHFAERSERQAFDEDVNRAEDTVETAQLGAEIAKIVTAGTMP